MSKDLYIVRDSSSNISNAYGTYFDSYKAAQYFVCKSIMARIRSNWNPPNCNLDQQDVITVFNNHIKNNELIGAITDWNDYVRTSTHPTIVGMPKICEFEISVVAMFDDTNYNASQMFPFTNDELGFNGAIDPTPQIIVGSGAKCRKCNVDNEYATPDCVGGTYVCTGCKLFGAN